MMRSRYPKLLVTLCAAALSLSSGAVHATTTDNAAALVTYPLIAVEPANGIDTFVQLVNDDGAAVDVKCFLEDQTRQCLTGGARCLEDWDCSPGDSCEPPTPQVVEFDLTLTERQPISWQTSVGLAELPLPANSGAIPAVPALPFRGVLRCLAVDATGAPSDRNVLRGTATLEGYDAAQAALDRAKYNAVGNRAIPGGPNQDTELILGGPNAEYEGCAYAILMDFLTDQTIEPVRGDEVLNTLVAVPCTGTLYSAEPVSGTTILQIFVYNEFEQRFSTAVTVDGQLVRQLSTIDTNNTERSIFSAGVVGTPGGKLRSMSISAGSIAIAIERHRDVQTNALASAAFDLPTQGDRSEADVLFAGKPPVCATVPRSGCKSVPRASLSWTDKSADRGDRLQWRASRGDATLPADLGQPQTTTDYSVCVYGGAAPTRFATLEIPAGSPTWSTTNSGVRFSDPTASSDGVRKIQIQARGDKTRIVARGRGESLPEVDLSALAAPVVVQLVNDTGACWESTFGGGDIDQNTALRFRAKTRN